MKRNLEDYRLSLPMNHHDRNRPGIYCRVCGTEVLDIKSEFDGCSMCNPDFKAGSSGGIFPIPLKGQNEA